MEQVIYSEILPPLIFFIIFSIAFSLLELIVIFLLNRVEQKHWEFMIDVVIRFRVHHKKMIQYIIIVAVGVLVLSFILFTPLIEVMTLASNELRLFAALLALVMLLIYSINLRKSTRLDIEKKVYGTIFLVVSIVFYVFILILANERYKSYANYVNRQFISPAGKKVETVIEEKEETRLLKKFREQYLNNECEKADYTQEKKEILLKNLQLIASEPKLAFGDKTVDITDPAETLRGMACSDGEHTFLLVENGNWYWVSEEYLQFIETN